MTTKAICEFCGKEYEFDENNVRLKEEGRRQTYDSSKYCCQTCAIKHCLAKQKETLSKKLGYEVKSTFHLPGVQEKAQETSLKRYGTKFGVCSKQSVEKRKKTCLERYGVEYALQNKDIKQKTYDSDLKNHNGTSHLLTQEVKDKAAAGHRTDEYKEKARALFDVESKKRRVFELYGVENVGLTIPNHQEEDKTLETDFFNFISSLTDKEVLRNTRNVIAPLELDIYIPDMKLAFEFNGNYWHSENFGRGKNYHLIKTEICNKVGVRLIHIWEDEWVNNRSKIEIFIKSLFVRREKIRASKCEIKEVSNREFMKFAEDYHLLGSTSASTRIGLFFNGELVSAIGLIYDKKHSEWNLKRYIVGNYQIMGGFEKMFSYFKTKHNPDKIVTFVELSKFNGTVNFRNGFVLDKEMPPDFFWVINGVRADKWTVWRQFKDEKDSTEIFQKKMKKFALKCYDAGKLRLIWTK